MRDIALVLVFVCAIPYMIKHPWMGVIMWVWLSVMNPHRLTYGFAHDMQFAAAAAGITFIALLIFRSRSSRSGCASRRCFRITSERASRCGRA
jgi:hypothetical protein